MHFHGDDGPWVLLVFFVLQGDVHFLGDVKVCCLVLSYPPNGDRRN